MAIYLDSAILTEAQQAREFGWVRGVTTNPTLMAKAGVAPEVVLRGLAGLQFPQVFYQIISTQMEDMLVEAKKAAEIVPEGLIYKIVPTQEGFRFVARVGQQFPCCVTAVFDPAQALVAREAGANYIAIYVNRAARLLGDGLGLLSRSAEILAGSQTEIVAASLKSKQEAVDAFLAGAQHITLPFEGLASLHNHSLSAQVVSQFAQQGTGLHLR